MSAADDTQLALALARAAGAIAIEVRANGLLEGRALGDAGDKTVNAFLMAALRQHRADQEMAARRIQAITRGKKGRGAGVSPRA